MSKINYLSNVLEGNNVPNYLYIGEQSANKIIDLLRGSLYSDKWGSFIREVVSNAYDANRTVGYEGPVEIYLPNILGHELIIKDCGTGMSKEFMENCYTNVGLSTKEDDENTIGAWGIGRLSPLLISDSYKVETIYDGIKYVYTMAIGRKHGLILEYEEPTKESNGTTIKIPYDAKNNKQVIKALEDWCGYMNPLPIVDGIPIKGKTLTLIEGMEDRKWWLSDSNYGIIVLNDWVPYKVNVNIISQGWAHSFNMFSQMSLVIRFDVGELGITASREDLEYTDKTVNSIRSKLTYIKEVIKTCINNKLQTTNEIKEVCNYIYQFNSSFHQGLVWKDIKLDNLNLSAKRLNAGKYFINTYGNGDLSFSRSNYENLIKEKYVFIDDLKKKPKRDRILLYLTSLSNKNVSLFTVPNEMLEDKLVAQMDWPLLSSLPIPPKDLVEQEEDTNKISKHVFKVNKKEVKVYEWLGNIEYNSLPNFLKYTKPISLNTECNGTYLLVRRGEIVKDKYVSLDYDSNLINDLVNYLPNSMKPLYLIPECNFSLMKGEWKLLNEVVIELLKDKMDLYLNLFVCKGYLCHSVKGYSWETHNKYIYELARYLNKEGIDKFLPPTNLFRRYIEESLKIKECLNTVPYNELTLASKVTLTLPIECKLKTLYNQIITKYRLFECYPYFSYDPNKFMLILIDYIKGIDLLQLQETN